jgi:coproporphyrinogen III oxidase
MVSKEEIEQYFRGLQDKICFELENADQIGRFKEDNWEHNSGGGGRSRVIRDGKIIEKGGVNFSAVRGTPSETLKKQMNLDENADYFATGVSIVLHPKNVHVPIIHMNVRYFELSNGDCWFGGGIDLTPHYVNDADATFFHNELKKVCDVHHPNFYPTFKTWADAYFYLPHRQETRGIGGIFFDYLKPKEQNTAGVTSSKTQIFEFVKSVGELFAPVYTHFMLKNHEMEETEEQKKWQMLRRGRYVEFNLVWDRGTKFGLESNGRTESILMSLPPVANWEYDFQPTPNSAEATTLSKLVKGINWVE